ncbi:MAG TPA: pyrroline-5-carboxylate reductase [Acidimicrobiales bacterium]|nr:pyrroline-5-carboxylate reductase [Acidimicrobiales bacterium]
MVAKLLLVGAGKMGEALLVGLFASGWARPAEVVVNEVSEPRRAQLAANAQLAGARVTGGDLVAAEGVVIAVKPADVEAVCRRLAELFGKGDEVRVLSVAAGVHVAELETWCGPSARVVRAMPNLPAVMGAAATAIAGGPRSTREDVSWARELMSGVGIVEEVPEALLDVVTGLSGSGPAYLFLVVEAMTEAGVLLGLPRQVASKLVAQTLLGAGRLLVETGQSPQDLRAAVTSPGGTTAAALRELERNGVRSAFIEAVAASAARSRELSGA